MTVADLKTGQTIRFTRIAPGSYCRVGEAYRIDVERQYVHVVNVEHGSGTFDSKSILNLAAFELA